MRGSSATTPPSWPPSAVTAARCTLGEIVVRTACAGCGDGVASTRAPAEQLAAGRSAQATSSARSRPLVPTIACGGHALRFQRCAREPGIGPTSPITALATAAERRAARAAARFVGRGLRRAPSRRAPAASRAAAASVRRVSGSPARRPGNASERDHAIRGPPSAPLASFSAKSSESVPEQARVDAHRNRDAPAGGAARAAGHAQAASRSPCAALRGRRRRMRSGVMRAPRGARRRPRTSPRSRRVVHAATNRSASASRREEPLSGAERSRRSANAGARQRDDRSRAASQTLVCGSSRQGAVEHDR